MKVLRTLPSNGIASETWGNCSATSVIKTVSDSRIVISVRKITESKV